MADPESKASGDIPAVSSSAAGGKQIKRDKYCALRASHVSRDQEKVGHTTLNANNEPQKFKKLELENLQRSIQHGMLTVISNKKLYEPERQMLMVDLEQVVMLNIQGSEVPSSVSNSRLLSHVSGIDVSDYHANESGGGTASPTSSGSSHVSVANYRFKAYAPRAFDFFRKIYKVDKAEFMRSIGAPMKCIPNPGASGSLFFISGDDCFIMKTLQKKEATFLLELYPGYILNLYQSPDTLLPKYFGCYCYQSILGKNVRVAIMNNLIPRNVTLWKKYDLKGSTYKRLTDVSKSSSKVPTLKDLNFINDFKGFRILLESDVYNALINRLENDTLMLESFQIMDYSFLMAIEEVDEEKDRVATLRPGQDNVPSFYQYSEILNLPMLRHQKGIPAKKEEDGKGLRLYVGIIDILQKYVMKKKLEHRVKAVFLESQDNEVSVTHPTKFQKRFMNFMKNTVFKEEKTYTGARPSHLYTHTNPYAHHSNTTYMPHHQTSSMTSHHPNANHNSLTAGTLKQPGSKPQVFASSSSGLGSDLSPSSDHSPNHRGSVGSSGQPCGPGAEMPRTPTHPVTSTSNSNKAEFSSRNTVVESSTSTSYYRGGNQTTPNATSRSRVTNQMTQGANVIHSTPRSTSTRLHDDVDFDISKANTSTPRVTSTIDDESPASYRNIRTASTTAPVLAKQESLSGFNKELDDSYNETHNASKFGPRATPMAAKSKHHPSAQPSRATINGSAAPIVANYESSSRTSLHKIDEAQMDHLSAHRKASYNAEDSAKLPSAHRTTNYKTVNNSVIWL
ncbi:phosphatidylinositol 4-phosphate 5-kinase type-1 alpha-like isoform X2 [Symsagittifera roscoffensis]|uniref:phosphatidylinositol 4-phosphate 5-kinase type-1 alpha-like isoform X2 n=1 Tax=Symsagittifera roscoffensis TaxID=84072 RepID=UPI00307B3738